MKILGIIKIFAMIPVIWVFLGLNVDGSDKADEAKRKFEASDYLPTLSVRDTTSMYTYRVMTIEEKLQIHYLKAPLVPPLKFNYKNESKIINSRGDLLEVVISSSDQLRSYFYIKGEMVDPGNAGYKEEYFRVRILNDNEYVFRFGQDPNYRYAIFLRNKMKFLEP